MMVTDRSQLSSAVAAMLAYDGPVLMDVHVRKDENCYPMVAPGKGNHQMLGLPAVHGTKSQHELTRCVTCGQDNASTSNFCSNCGTKL
jgi:acetolactate synthase-1/2/3 large subunit